MKTIRDTFKEREKKKMKRKHTDEAFNNINDLLSKLSKKGYESYFKNKDDMMNKTEITELGVILNVKNNKQNTPYSIIVTPTYLTDKDEFRKKILEMADSIFENFPNLNEQQQTIQ